MSGLREAKIEVVWGDAAHDQTAMPIIEHHMNRLIAELIRAGVENCAVLATMPGESGE